MTTLAELLQDFYDAEENEVELSDETKEQLKEKIDNYYEAIRLFEGIRDSHLVEIERLDDRVASCDRKIDKIKNHLLNQMVSFGWEKLQGKNISVSLRTSESVEVLSDDFEKFAEFARKKVAYSWDKKAIKEALDEGYTDVTKLATIKKTTRVYFK